MEPNRRSGTFCRQFLNPQDEVIVLAPYWVSYPEMVRMVGGIPSSLLQKTAHLFEAFDEIETCCQSCTKSHHVNSPNNPSGAIYPESLICQIVTLCESRNIYMICDDDHHKLVFGWNVAVPAYKCTGKDVETPGFVVEGEWRGKIVWDDRFRIGWVLAHRKLVEILPIFQSQTDTCVSPFCKQRQKALWTGIQSNGRSIAIEPCRTTGTS